MNLLLWPSAYPPAIGGVETLCAGLAASLHDRGHAVTVITESDDQDAGTDPPGPIVHRFAFHAALSSRDPGIIADLVERVAEIEASAQPDLVNVHAIHPSLFFFLRSRTSMAPPTVFTSHGWGDQRLGPDTVTGRVVRAADQIVGCSRFVTDRGRQVLPDRPDRMRTIVNGLRPVTGPTVDLPDGPPLVVGVGRLEPEKGFDVFLSAFAEVLERCPEVRGVVVGDGSERDRLQQVIDEADLTSDVRLVGRVSSESVTAWLDAARVVVVPSLGREQGHNPEPFGLVAGEAGQRGRPVVASRSGGLAEIVEHGVSGYLVGPGERQGLADALGRVVADRDLAHSLGAGGRAVVAERFGWDRLVDEYEALYQSIVTEGA